MSWSFLDTDIVLVAGVSAMASALIGTFLVLRGMSMMGDAISHAVLPGIALAFLITHSRDTGVIVVGAAIAGVATAAFTQLIHEVGNVDRGAAMGVVFTTLFAVGLILIVRSADSVHIDVHAVFYGAVELTPLNTITIAGVRLPRALLILAAVFAADLAFVLFLYKELNITSFDPALATALGFNARLMHYALMIMVAVTIVAAFESVGSILVIAMLIVPGAVASMFTRRLWSMLVLGQILAAAFAVSGHVGAITVPRWFGLSDTSTAGMMTVMAGVAVVVALVVAPERGLVARLIRRLQVGIAVGRQDILVELLRSDDRGEPCRSRAALVGEEVSRIAGRSNRFDRSFALLTEVASGRVQRRSGGFGLSTAGREAATMLLRKHRLWESYLFEKGATARDEVHFAAHQLEHVTSDRLQRELTLEASETDPHGKPVPSVDPEAESEAGAE